MPQVTAQVSRSIAARPEQIWTALTSPDKLKRFFLGADVTSDWTVGSPIRMRGEYQGKAYEDKGEILRADRPRTLEFSHWSGSSGQADVPENYHVLTFDLTPDGDRTDVTLSQSNLKGGVTPSDEQHRAEFEKNWQTVLDGLAHTVEH